ncbi:MAG: NTP transferase domain-containing protein [Candidatus Izemoplasmatales bacterium]|nr:NTP transferase domain-containing protein [Candidatus Izemoplasmatales bacterium]
MADVIILAGGLSRRVGKNKLVLPYRGKPLLYHVIDTFSPFVDHVIVVTGHYHQELKEILHERPFVQIAYNPMYEQGMFTSIQCGAKYVEGDFFIIPGDYPLIRSETIQAMLEVQAEMLVPRYRGIKGHPLKVMGDLKEELLSEPSTSNLKVFRDRHRVEILDVDDEGILKDIDTCADYQALPE